MTDPAEPDNAAESDAAAPAPAAPPSAEPEHTTEVLRVRAPDPTVDDPRSVPTGNYPPPRTDQTTGTFPHRPGSDPAYGNWPPGSSSAPPPGDPSPQRRGRTLLVFAASVAVLAVAAVLITGLWKPGFLRSTQLDVNAVQDGVQQVLTRSEDGYGLARVSNVRCNDGVDPVIRAGATFDCEAIVNRVKKTVPITFADDSGTYWVGVPG